MFLYEGMTDYRKTVYDYDFGGQMQSKSDFNGNFEMYDGEYIEEYEKRPKEPKLNLGKFLDFFVCAVFEFGILFRYWIYDVGCWLD